MKMHMLLAKPVAIFALLAAPVAHAQQATPAPADETAVTAAKEDAAGSPALWKVADDDTTIYLFGTVHTLPDDVNWYSGSVKEALNSSGTLVTEINMTPENMQTMGALIGSKGMLPAGETLRDLMTEEQKATYEAGLAKINVPPQTFDQMEPWLASIAILQIVTQASGFSEDKGVENVLEATVAPETERVALETVEFQISVFDELPIDQQVAFLLEGAADPMEGIAMLNQLIAEWAEGDVETVGDMMNEAMMAHPLLAERLLYSRNATWADWIEGRMDEPGTVFIAVGAGHLSGNNSVQDYLAESGITAARVQ